MDLLKLFIFACIVTLHAFCNAVSDDPYAILGVKRTASGIEIKKAYKRLARSWHPDKNKDPSAQDRFVKINAAYEILSDEEKKEEYDRYGTVGGKQNMGPGSPFHNQHGFHHFSQGPDGSYSFFFNEMPFASFFNSRPHSKPSVTVHYLQHTVLPDSFETPFMAYVYGDWCFECAKAEEVWDNTSSELESVGIKTFEAHVDRDHALIAELGVRRIPSFVGIVGGRIIRYKRPEVSHVALRDFMDSLLPTVPKIDSSTSLDFFVKSFNENKPQVLLFSKRLFVPLLFTVVAYKNRKRMNFAFVDVTSVSSTSLRKKYNIKDSETSVVLLKEEPSNPVAVLKDASLKAGALRDLVKNHQFMYLPRVSAWEIFDELCPVSFKSDRRICVVLFTRKDQDHSAYRYTLRSLATDSTWKSKGVYFLYVNEDVQTEFTKAFKTPPEMDPCQDGSETLKLVVLWHKARGKVAYDWFPGGWCRYHDRSLTMKTELEIMLTDLIHDRKSLGNEATFEEIVDEHEKSMVEYFIDRAFLMIQYIVDSFDSPNWNSSLSLLSFVLFLVVIVMLSVFLPMADDLREFGKGGQSKQRHVGDETVLGLKKLSPFNQLQLVSGSQPGQITIVLLLDAGSVTEVAQSPLTQAFADAIYGYTANSSYVFTYLSIQDHLVWCTEIMEVTKFGEVVPGTVLAINGFKKYVYIFKPQSSINYSAMDRESNRGILNGDFIGLEDSEDEFDSDSLRQMERRKQKIGALYIRKHLPIWLERLYEGTLKDKKVLEQWPKME